jgi:tetratricopeptide (TPR) repeat protein
MKDNDSFVRSHCLDVVHHVRFPIDPLASIRHLNELATSHPDAFSRSEAKQALRWCVEETMRDEEQSPLEVFCEWVAILWGPVGAFLGILAGLLLFHFLVGLSPEEGSIWAILLGLDGVIATILVPSLLAVGPYWWVAELLTKRRHTRRVESALQQLLTNAMQATDKSAAILRNVRSISTPSHQSASNRTWSIGTIVFGLMCILTNISGGVLLASFANNDDLRVAERSSSGVLDDRWSRGVIGFALGYVVTTILTGLVVATRYAFISKTRAVTRCSWLMFAAASLLAAGFAAVPIVRALSSADTSEQAHAESPAGVSGTDLSDFDSLVKRAQECLDRREYAKAINYFDRAIEIDPRSAVAFHGRGKAKSMNPATDFDGAINDFDKAITLDPTNAEYYFSRGTAWKAKKDFDTAIQDLDRAIELDPQHVSAFQERGAAKAGRAEYDEAIADFNEAIRLVASEIAPDVSLQATVSPRGFDEAIRLQAKSVFGKSKVFASMFFDRGLAYASKAENTTAIKDYTVALELDPMHVDAWLYRGISWDDKGDDERAIHDLNEAIRLDPKNITAFYARGRVRYGQTLYDEAVRDFAAAIRLKPGSGDAWAGKASALLAMGHYNAAIDDYNEAIRFEPKHDSAHFHRAVAFMLTQRAEAAGRFQEVLDLIGWNDNRAPYVVVLGHLAARQAGDEPVAKQFLNDSAGKLDEGWPYPVLKFLRGEIDEAALLGLASDDDKRTEARCYLGFDHALKGRKDEALAHFRWVKEHGNATFIEYTIAVAELKRLE